MNRSMPGLSVHHQLLEFTQTHVHQVSDAIQPSHPLSSPSPPTPNPTQHQGLFQRLNSSQEVAKVYVHGKWVPGKEKSTDKGPQAVIAWRTHKAIVWPG